MFKSKKKADKKTKKITSKIFGKITAPAARGSQAMESLESRQLLTAWSTQDTIVGLDRRAQNFPTITGAGETVAIIDRGLDYNHPDFGGNGVGPGHKIVAAWNFDNNTGDVFPYDNDSHATGTAGEIAANPHVYNGQTYSGVAPGVQIAALKAQGGGEIKNALDWIIANRTRYNIVAVNYVDMWGSDQNQFYSELKALNAAGVFVGGPVGNYGPSTAYGRGDGLIYEAGSTNFSDQLSWITPRGKAIDLVAPGENVTLTYQYNGQHIEYAATGTSWAGPQMTGTAALIKQVNSNFSPAQIMQIMRDSAKWVWDGYSNMSYARLDVNAAVGLAFQRSGQAAPAPAPAPAPTPAPTPTPPPSTGSGYQSNPTPTTGATPYNGTPFAVGATFDAVNFDNGGEGVGYHDSSASNEGTTNYRSGGVDTGWTNGDGGGQYVGWTRGGEWMSYSVNVATAGTFNFNARVAASGAGGNFHVEVDGNNVTGSLNIWNTGSWDSYATLTKGGINLSAGKHTLRVVMDSNGQNGCTGNFRSFSLTSTGGGTGTGTGYAPATNTVPNAPYGMSVLGNGSTSLKVTFSDNANNESAYVIERAVSGGAFGVVATITVDQATSQGTGLRSWIDYNLVTGQAYVYRIKAINQVGSSSYTGGYGATPR